MSLLLSLWAACGWLDAEEAVVPPSDAPAEEAPPDPFGDAADMSPVPASPAMIGAMAPTPLSSARVASTPAEAPAILPHVVLVMGCTVRKDQFALYGAPRGPTPFLDGVATRGVVFDDVIASAPWTRAAATAMLTGHHAVELGMAEGGKRRNDRALPGRVPTLATRLKDAGYATVGVTANPNLDAVYGFDQGFDHYQEHLPPKPKAKIPGKATVKALLTSLDGSGALASDQPVFLQAMLVDPHAPRRNKPEVWADWTRDGEPARMAAYRHHLHQLDEAVAMLHDELATRGITDDNTLFVFIADHGEGMQVPEHHGFAHGRYMMPSAVHVPWILWGAGVAQGHRVLGVASQEDLVDTVFGVVGAPLPDDTLPGLDLSGAVRGTTGLTGRDVAFVDTWFQGSNRAAIFTHTTMCQRDFGSHERARKAGSFVPGCFDRLADPALTAPDVPARALEASLVAWRKAVTGSAPAADASPDEVQAERLKALGYTED